MTWYTSCTGRYVTLGSGSLGFICHRNVCTEFLSEASRLPVFHALMPCAVFPVQRMDLGECLKVHDLALRADYEIASKHQEYFFELDVSVTRDGQPQNPPPGFSSVCGLP